MKENLIAAIQPKNGKNYIIARTKNKKRNIVLSLLSILLLSGCASDKNATTTSAVSDLSDKTIVFFGDSITQNFEVEEASYPDLVGSRLHG